MSKKGENIYKRKDGRWEARYVKGYDPSGKISYGYCYGKTYKEARSKVALARNFLIPETPIHEQKEISCFSYYCTEWMNVKKYEVRESTFIKYNTVINKYILPKLGNYSPTMITVSVTDGFRQELLKENLSSKTVHDILSLLHSILKYTSRQFSDIFPTIEISYPKEVRTEMRVLTLKEQKMFTDYLLSEPDRCRIGILLALLTGMRIGELCALKWKDISLDERTIQIFSSVQRLKDLDSTDERKTKVVIGKTKSGSSMRIIPITEFAADICKSVYVEDGEAYLLTGTEKCMEPRTLQYRFSKYVKECGLEGVHFHTMRHTFATRCLEVGFDIKSLSEILGHANTTITLNRYVHSSFELKRDNMKKLDAIGL